MTAIKAMEAEILRLKQETWILRQLVMDLMEIVNTMNRREAQDPGLSEQHKAMLLADLLGNARAALAKARGEQ